MSDVLSMIYISDINIQKEASHNKTSSSLVSICISLCSADTRAGPTHHMVTQPPDGLRAQGFIGRKKGR